jgi:hypothetical protein
MAVIGAQLAVSLDIAFKPVVKVLCHCEASWRGVNAFIEAG